MYKNEINRSIRDEFILQKMKKSGMCGQSFLYSLLTFGNLFAFCHYKWQSFELCSSYNFSSENCEQYHFNIKLTPYYRQFYKHNNIIISF